MTNKSDKSNFLYLGILILFVTITCVPAFYIQTIPGAISDISVHINGVQQYAIHGGWFQYSIYYLLVYLTSFTNTTLFNLQVSAVIILTFSVILKTSISYMLINKNVQNKPLSLLSAIILMFVSSIVTWWNPTHVYYGQLSPTIWHNSTTILAIPFTILLFYLMLIVLDNPSIKNLSKIGILIIINLLAKPNYLLCFLPVFFLLIMIKLIKSNLSIRRKVLYMVLIIVPPVILLAYEYINTFTDDIGIQIAPFTVWKLSTPNIIASLILSILFPLIYTISYLKTAIKSKPVLYSWLIFIMALLQFILFSETGARFGCGNFAWGCYISNYILFLTCLISLLKQQNHNAKYYFSLLILSMHFLSGVFYFYRISLGMGFW